MSRRNRPPPIKRRTREHVIADLGVNFVERQVLRCGWTVERTTHDYGIDLFMRSFSPDGEPEPGSVLLQVKSTDRPQFRDGRKTIALRLESRDVRTWCREMMPVVLILYDGQSDAAWWVHVQQYYGEVAGRRLPTAATTTIRFSAADVLSETAVRGFALSRDAAIARMPRVVFHEDGD